MKCPRCQHENLPQANFCNACGSPLEVRCAGCGHSNPAGSRFCNHCGQAFGSGAPTAAVPDSPPPAPPSVAAYTPKHLAEKILKNRSALEGERRQVTVLFADIAGFTSLAEGRDPEDIHQVIDRCFELITAEVHRFEGTINQYTGDGVMALFGAPIAHEDAPRRAVHAALGIQRALRDCDPELREKLGAPLSMRIGIHTGPVVVGRIGDDLRMDYTAVGDTTNLAARLQQTARAGSVVVGAATHRMIADYFETVDLGERSVKGRAPVHAFEVLRARGRRARLDVAAERGLTPLVGRERERDALRDLFDRAKRGHGQVVCIAGEAGIGKSRLVYEFRRSLAERGEDATWLEGRCISFGQTMPLLPVVDQLRENFGIEEVDGDPEIVAKVEHGMRRMDHLEPHIPYIRYVLSVDPGDPAVGAMEAVARRKKVFDAITALCLRGAFLRRIVFVFEDLHWIDHSTQEYLTQLIDSLATARIMLILTYRLGYSPPWGTRSFQTTITLDSLSEAETLALAGHVLGVEHFPVELRDALMSKAEGVPLFVEEVTKVLLDLGILRRENGGYRLAKRLDEINVPATIQGIIMARLDRLGGNGKRTVQLASVIGRQFLRRLLERVGGLSGQLEGLLAELKALEIIYEQGLVPEPAYVFKHAVIQEVAYQSLLVHRRKELHRTVGLAIEELYADRLAEHYGELAHHFSLADERAKALGYLMKAGDGATATAAYKEAADTYRRALDFIAPADLRSRADALHKLSMVRFFTGDFGSGVAEGEEALALYERLGDKPTLLAANLETMRAYTGGAWDGAFEDRAIPHLEAAARLMEHEADTIEKGLVYQRLGHFHMHRGEFGRTLEWAERARDVFTSIGMSMGTSLGTALTYGGRVNEGLAYNENNWEPVARSGNLLVVGVLGHELATTLALLRDPRAAVAAAERALAIVRAEDSSMSHGIQGHGVHGLRAMILRPLVLACTLTRDVARAAQESQALRDIELRTFYGCVFEDGLAIAFYELSRGETERALAYLGQVVPIFEQRNLAAAVNACGFARGAVELARGNAQEAVGWLTRSLETCRRNGNVLFELWVLSALAEAYLARGETRRAAECVGRGLELLTPGEHWRGLPAPLHRARGMVALAEGRRDEAARVFEESLAISRQYGLAWDEARTLEARRAAGI